MWILTLTGLLAEAHSNLAALSAPDLGLQAQVNDILTNNSICGDPHSTGYQECIARLEKLRKEASIAEVGKASEENRLIALRNDLKEMIEKFRLQRRYVNVVPVWTFNEMEDGMLFPAHVELRKKTLRSIALRNVRSIFATFFDNLVKEVAAEAVWQSSLPAEFNASMARLALEKLLTGRINRYKEQQKSA